MAAKTPRNQAAFGVLELLISMVLGLMVVGAIAGLFLQHKTNFRQNEQLALMQENGRYALTLLADDLELGGFWGGPDCSNLAACRPSATINVQNDCDTNWAVPTTAQTSSPFPTVQYVMASSSTSAPVSWACFNSSDYLKPGTNVLAVKHAQGKPVYCKTNTDDFTGLVYLQTNGSTGTLVQSPLPPDCPVAPNALAFWRYVVHVYYITRGYTATQCAAHPTDGRCTPRLVRKTLGRQNGNPVIFENDDGGEIAEGIEYFFIEFGVDDGDGSMTNGVCQMDGTPETYLDSSSDLAAVSANEFDCAISARIHVLVRSIEADSSYTDNKTYTFGSDADAVSLTFNDHFRRKVFTTTVQLRNQQI